MEVLAVQLDTQPTVLGVVAVTVATRAVRLQELGLLDRLGKPMSSLYVRVMPVLKRRVRAPGAQGDDLVKVIPRAELLTGLRHRPEMVFCEELPVEPAGDEGDDVVFV